MGKGVTGNGVTGKAETGKGEKGKSDRDVPSIGGTRSALGAQRRSHDPVPVKSKAQIRALRRGATRALTEATNLIQGLSAMRAF